MEAIRNVLLQRLTPEGKVVVISTLWTENDPAIWMMDGWKASATPAVYVNLAALNEDGTASFRQNIVTGEREYIEPYAVLWPEYRDLKFIEAKRKEMRCRGLRDAIHGQPDSDRRTRLGRGVGNLRGVRVTEREVCRADRGHRHRARRVQ